MRILRANQTLKSHKTIRIHSENANFESQSNAKIARKTFNGCVLAHQTHVGSMLVQFWPMSVPCWSHVGTFSVPCCSHFDSILIPCWSYVNPILVPFYALFDPKGAQPQCETDTIGHPILGLLPDRFTAHHIQRMCSLALAARRVSGAGLGCGLQGMRGYHV